MSEPAYTTTVGPADEDGYCRVTIFENGGEIDQHYIRSDMADQWAAQEAECLNDDRPLEEKLADETWREHAERIGAAGL